MSTISSAGNSPVYRPDVSSSQQGGAAQGAKGASDVAPPDAAGAGAPSGAASSAPTQYTEAARAETPAQKSSGPKTSKDKFFEQTQKARSGGGDLSALQAQLGQQALGASGSSEVKVNGLTLNFEPPQAGIGINGNDRVGISQDEKGNIAIAIDGPSGQRGVYLEKGENGYTMRAGKDLDSDPSTWPAVGKPGQLSELTIGSGDGPLQPGQVNAATALPQDIRFTQPEWAQRLLPQMNPDGSLAPAVIGFEPTKQTIPLFGN